MKMLSLFFKIRPFVQKASVFNYHFQTFKIFFYIISVKPNILLSTGNFGFGKNTMSLDIAVWGLRGDLNVLSKFDLLI